MCVTYWSVPWIRQLIAGLSSRRPGFDPSIVHVAFIVEVAALGHFYLTTSGFPTVTFHQCSIFVHWHYISLANDRLRKGCILPTAMLQIYFRHHRIHVVLQL